MSKMTLEQEEERGCRTDDTDTYSVGNYGKSLFARGRYLPVGTDYFTDCSRGIRT